MQQLVKQKDVTLETNHYKTIFLSDIHLGSRACQADFLLDFLKYNDSENLSKAVDQALPAPARQARRHAEKYSWNACTDQFLQNLVRAS